MILIYDVNKAHSERMAEQVRLCQVNTKKKKFYVQEEICSLNAENVGHTTTLRVLSASVVVRNSRKFAQTADLKLKKSMRSVALTAAKSFTHDLQWIRQHLLTG